MQTHEGQGEFGEYSRKVGGGSFLTLRMAQDAVSRRDTGARETSLTRPGEARGSGNGDRSGEVHKLDRIDRRWPETEVEPVPNFMMTAQTRGKSRLVPRWKVTSQSRDLEAAPNRQDGSDGLLRPYEKYLIEFFRVRHDNYV